MVYLTLPSFPNNPKNHSDTYGLLCSQAPFSKKKPTLGSLVKDKSKEHLLNAIMRQADREGLPSTLAFPNKKKWIIKNLSTWFGEGGVLAE